MPPNWRVSKIKRRLLQKDFEFSSVITEQQGLFKQQFQYILHITAFCYFWYLRNFGRDIHFD